MRGELRQFARLRGVFGDRFFDEKMLSFFEKRLRDREMRVGRRGDRGGVDQLGKLLERSGRAHLVLLGDLRGVRGIGVVDGGEFCRVRLGIKTRVIFSDMSDADHPDP